MCFWWLKMASFCALSPGSRNSCRQLEKHQVLGGGPLPSHRLKTSLHMCGRHRPRPSPPRAVAGKGNSGPVWTEFPSWLWSPETQGNGLLILQTLIKAFGLFS